MGSRKAPTPAPPAGHKPKPPPKPPNQGEEMTREKNTYTLLETFRNELCTHSEKYRKTIEEHRDTLSTYKKGLFRGMSDAFGDAADMVSRLLRALSWPSGIDLDEALSWPLKRDEPKPLFPAPTAKQFAEAAAIIGRCGLSFAYPRDDKLLSHQDDDHYLDVKEISKRALSFAEDCYDAEVRLEEVHQDVELRKQVIVWMVTIAVLEPGLRSGKQPVAFYKQLELDQFGRVLSITSRDMGDTNE